MSSEGNEALAFPVRFADILFAADILGPNGGNPKERRVVVLTPDAALAEGFPIVAAAVTGTIPATLPADYVLLPYKNPPGTRHPKTGTTKKAAVVCSWLVTIEPDQVTGRSGFVPPIPMAIVHAKTAARAKALGGWA